MGLEQIKNIERQTMLSSNHELWERFIEDRTTTVGRTQGLKSQSCLIITKGIGHVRSKVLKSVMDAVNELSSLVLTPTCRTCGGLHRAR